MRPVFIKLQYEGMCVTDNTIMTLYNLVELSLQTQYPILALPSPPPPPPPPKKKKKKKIPCQSL